MFGEFFQETRLREATGGFEGCSAGWVGFWVLWGGFLVVLRRFGKNEKFVFYIFIIIIFQKIRPGRQPGGREGGGQEGGGAWEAVFTACYGGLHCWFRVSVAGVMVFHRFGSKK